MTVSLSSAAPLTFQVYNSETTVTRAADGSPLITGRTLPDAGPSDNARAWVGAIPRDGKYLDCGWRRTGGARSLQPDSLPAVACGKNVIASGCN